MRGYFCPVLILALLNWQTVSPRLKYAQIKLWFKRDNLRHWKTQSIILNFWIWFLLTLQTWFHSGFSQTSDVLESRSAVVYPLLVSLIVQTSSSISASILFISSFLTYSNIKKVLLCIIRMDDVRLKFLYDTIWLYLLDNVFIYFNIYFIYSLWCSFILKIISWILLFYD